MTVRSYARYVFGPTWGTRIQTAVGLILYVVLALIFLNESAYWGGPWG